MKDIIDNLITIFNAAITATTLSAKKVYKGLSSIPDQPPPDVFPYIAIDDSGERTERSSLGGLKRIYSVIFEFATLSYNVENNLDNCLTLSDQIKSLLEDNTNRQKDGHIWGINITPFDGQLEEGGKYYFRGRQVTVEFEEIQIDVDFEDE